MLRKDRQMKDGADGRQRREEVLPRPCSHPSCSVHVFSKRRGEGSSTGRPTPPLLPLSSPRPSAVHPPRLLRILP